MIMVITRPRCWLLASLLVPILLAGCGGGGGGGGGGESAAPPATSSSSPPPAAPTGFVDARATDASNGNQIAAPITIVILRPDRTSITTSGTGRVLSDNEPVGSTVTVTFGDFSASGYADPNPNPAFATVAAGANIVPGAYVPVPPPPPP